MNLDVNIVCGAGTDFICISSYAIKKKDEIERVAKANR